MSLIGAAVSGTVGAIVGKTISPLFHYLDGLKLTEEERAEIEVKKAEVLVELDKECAEIEKDVIEARKAVLLQELKQGDRFTKRARPSVVYVGLFVVVVNYILMEPLMHCLGQPDFVVRELPKAFWVAWSGILGTYSIGRTIEKVKATAGLNR